MVWYLSNYYRLDEQEAVDCVCDQRGDKGVDGIYVNDNSNTIDIFQCRLSQKEKSSVGDTALKEFVGTLTQFTSKSALTKLVASGGKAQVVSLVQRLDLLKKIETHEIRGVFICNLELDSNGKSYLDSLPRIKVRFVGRGELQKTHISGRRTTSISNKATFDISGFTTSKYIVDAKTKAIIAPVRGTELVVLEGIEDQSLFDFNVRGMLGRTQVNKDIAKSVTDSKTHKLFPLFHNGITIICRKLHDTADRIFISGYYVVNGCQTLNTLFENSNLLTEDLRILTKFVQVDVASDLSKKITWYSNNQNGVKARDFKSNDPIQVRLQSDFQKHYDGEYWLEIKRGETPGVGDVISNETAGLYLMSFDLKEPWATHRKYEVFDEKHSDIFARPEVTAHRIVFCHTIIKVINSYSNDIENKLFGKYALTRYVLLFIVRTILEHDKLGKKSLEDPKPFVKDSNRRERFAKSLENIIKDVIVDVNAEVGECGDDFDYRGKLRDADWVKDLNKKVVSNFLKLEQRGRVNSFEAEWKQHNA